MYDVIKCFGKRFVFTIQTIYKFTMFKIDIWFIARKRRIGAMGVFFNPLKFTFLEPFKVDNLLLVRINSQIKSYLDKKEENFHPKIDVVSLWYFIWLI